ncbi:MAG: helix-turn-helix domain-containing protein [Hyphomicrobiales bacterium]|nr:helix-turn-helix domain-containing protein [Hyphomicrobiales bacterium]
MAALRKKGTSLAELARRLKFARCTMSWALIKPHVRAQAAIAAALDVPLHELWPQWYAANGAPRFVRIASPQSRTVRRKNSRLGRGAHYAQKAERRSITVSRQRNSQAKNIPTNAEAGR